MFIQVVVAIFLTNYILVHKVTSHAGREAGILMVLKQMKLVRTVYI